MTVIRGHPDGLVESNEHDIGMFQTTSVEDECALGEMPEPSPVTRVQSAGLEDRIEYAITDVGMGSANVPDCTSPVSDTWNRDGGIVDVIGSLKDRRRPQVETSQ